MHGDLIRLHERLSMKSHSIRLKQEGLRHSMPDRVEVSSKSNSNVEDVDLGRLGGKAQVDEWSQYRER